MVRLSPLGNDYKSRIVRITNNVLDLSPSLKKESLNLLIAIECALQKTMTNKAGGLENCGEIKLEIPRMYVTLHHQSGVPTELNELMDLAIVFQRSIPGCTIHGCTRMISGVEYRMGHFYVTVPGDAVPLFLYYGQDVGFTLLEESVFFHIKKLPHKLLYLFLLSKTDKESPRTYVKVSVAELYQRMGIRSAIPISSVTQKYLKTFSDALQDADSRYIITIPKKPQKQGYTGKVGRKPIDEIHFIIENSKRNCAENGDPLAEAVDKLTKLFIKHGPKTKVGPAWLIGELMETHREDEFLAKMMRISKKNEKENNIEKLANTAVKILREDFGILI